MTEAQIKAWFEAQSVESEKRCAEACGITVEEWRQKIAESVHEGRMRAMPEVDALLAANWQMQIPVHERCSEPWQLQWRRPPRRAGSKGRLFLSTTQAYNALKREQAVTHTPGKD